MPRSRATPQRPDLLRRTFEACLLLKGLNAALELGTAAFFGLVGPGALGSWLHVLTAGELAEDPHDLLVNWIVQAGARYSTDAQHFLVFYLVCHGLVKLGLVVLLWRGKPWAFPLAAGVLALFVVWLGIRWAHAHSGILLLLGGFDLVMIWLVLAEHRRLRPAAPFQGTSLRV